MHFLSQTVLVESQEKKCVCTACAEAVCVYLGCCITKPCGQQGAVSQRFRITNHSFVVPFVQVRLSLCAGKIGLKLLCCGQTMNLEPMQRWGLV